MERRSRRFLSTPQERPAEDIVEAVTTLKDVQKIRIEQHTFAGGLWCVGWLFTIGYLHLSFWKALLAVVIWAYFLGAHFSAVAH